MTHTPQVSVIMPAHNAQATIGWAIQSVLQQTHQDFELLVVDDGSTDATEACARTHGDRVRYLRQARAGPAAARNRGASEARGAFMAFLDADDLWLRRKLDLQLQAFAQEPSLDAVQTSAYLVDDALEVVGARPWDASHTAYLDFLLLRNLPAFSSSVMIRKGAFDAVGGFATDLVMETWDMACRIARHGRLGGVPEYLVLYRRHAGNRSRNVGQHLETGLRSLNRLFTDPTLDPAIRSQQARIWARFYAMLCGGYFQNREWGSCLYWASRALATSPSVGPYMAGMPLRHLGRALSSVPRFSVDDELPFVEAA